MLSSVFINCVYTAAATFSLMFVIVVRTHQQVTVMITGLNEIRICVCLHFNWDSLYQPLCHVHSFLSLMFSSTVLFI